MQVAGTVQIVQRLPVRGRALHVRSAIGRHACASTASYDLRLSSLKAAHTSNAHRAVCCRYDGMGPATYWAGAPSLADLKCANVTCKSPPDARGC